MSEKILISCDSGADIGPELASRYGIKVLPLNVRIGKNVWQDGENITPFDIYDYYEKKGILPVTSEPTYDQTYQFFTRYARMGYTIIHFTISSRLSKSYENAAAAADDINKPIHVIDTGSASCGSALIVAAAADLLQQGKSAGEIISACYNLVGKAHVGAIVDDLEFLYAGGRISGLKKFGAGLLKIKPSVQMRDGELVQDKNYRGGFKDVLPKFVSDHLEDKELDTQRMFLCHAGIHDSMVRIARNQLDEIVHCADFQSFRIGCTISSHLGKNTIVLAYMTK